MKIKNNNKLFAITTLTLGMLFSAATQAAGFEIAVAPSRFELGGTSSQRIGQSLEIQNLATTSTEVSVRTLDWSYSEDGKITYHDELLPNSCRQWVTIERSLVDIPPNGKRNFRFQLDIPPNAPRTECRFMLALEGVEPTYRTLLAAGGANLSLPVSGRIAVAVYLAVNGAEPQLRIGQVSVQSIKGQRVPVVSVTNQGDAHGRLSGALDGVDAMGRRFQLAPEGTPILPRQTRRLALMPQAEGNQRPALHYPISGQGRLDWSKGSFRLNATFK